MEKYQFTEDMREISGFGGGYEQACRDMVVAGMNWYDANPKALVDFSQYENVYGITFDESDDCKALQKAMLEVNDGCSGAQMQASLNHVVNAKKMGWEEYQKKMRELKLEEKED